MTPRPALLQDYVTPDDFAAHYGLSERAVREKARAIGACMIWGKRMILLPHHCEMLLEAAQQCHTQSKSAAKSGTSGALQPVGDYASLLAQRTKPQPKGLQHKLKIGHGKVILMDRGQA